MATTKPTSTTVDAEPSGAAAERSKEAAYTLAEPAPRTLSFFDQVGLWANLGVSLLGPVGAVFVLHPAGSSPLPLAGAFLAVVVGTVLGTLLLGLSTVPGAQTGAPAMMLLRGLFGARLSYLPTVLNIVQCVGWGTFEIVVISQAASQLLPWHATWPYVVAAGVLTTAMALKPLGAVRVLRRYALAGVVLASAYLFVQLLRHPLPSLFTGSWGGFWAGADVVIAVAVSWVPLSADYSRHARSAKAAFWGSFAGFTLTQIVSYTLGLVALSTVVVAGSSHSALQHDMFAAFIVVPAGFAAFGILALRELDQAFADTYSTVVSVQNLRPLADRRVLAVVVGAIGTALALALDIGDYASFLDLIGSVFVPMFAVFAVDYFCLRGRRRWDVSESAPSRWSRLAPWALGFASYQLVNPGSVPYWADGWSGLDHLIGFAPPSWVSASVLSFVVAGLATFAVAGLGWLAGAGARKPLRVRP